MNLGGKIMKKFISVLCAVTLVCCGLFLSCDNGNGGEPEAPNEAGGTDVVKQSGTFSVVISEITPASVNVSKDKTLISDGTFLDKDNYFKVSGSDAVWRTKDDLSELKAIEIGKNGKSSIEFTVTGKAAVTIGASSTGGSNTSDAVLWNENSDPVEEKNKITTVTGTSSTLLSYDIPAGTYRFVAAPATTNSRGVRVLSLTVEQTVE